MKNEFPKLRWKNFSKIFLLGGHLKQNVLKLDFDVRRDMSFFTVLKTTHTLDLT